MREAFAGVLGGYQGLGSDDSRERPIDRLAALAAAQIVRAKDAERTAALASLGVDLIRFKLANQASAKHDAEDKLSAVLAWANAAGKSAWGIRTSARERDRISRQAVVEWAIDFCPTCSGKGEIPDHDCHTGAQPMKVCPADRGCGGTGKRRYSDAERIEAMGESFAKAMAAAHGIIGRAEALAVRQAREMLERL